MTALLPVDISRTFGPSATDVTVDLHQHHHDIIHAAVNNQVSKGELVVNLRDGDGVVGDGRADDSDALQRAVDGAAKLGARVFANGTFRITRTLQLSGNTDLSDATLVFDGDGTAVLVGTPVGRSFRINVRLPRVVAARKTGRGWDRVAGSVGVAVQNCYNLDLTVPHVQGFETGLLVVGKGAGVAYCNVTLGHLDNNRTNLRLTADATGWANQNNFYGGRLSHNSAEGIRVAGSRHILIDQTTAKVNGNSFWGASLESVDIVEYALDCAGVDNYFMNCRWENGGTGARVLWRANSVGNVIAYGPYANGVVETNEAGSNNIVLTRANARFGSASAGFVRDNTYDLGTSGHRPRYVRAATGVQTGAFPKKSRPSAKTAGVGTCIFDTTLKRPIWSTGSTWVDANGKKV